MLLVNPFTEKLIDASDEVVDQLLRAGFKKQEPEAVASVDSVAAPPPRKRGRPPKTTS